MSFIQGMIDRIDCNLEASEANGSEDWFVAHLKSQRALLLQRAEEPEIVEWEEGTLEDDAELILTGNPVHGHTIAVDFLSELLFKLQNLLNEVAQSRFPDEEFQGRIRKDVLRNNRLVLSHVFPGSFGLRLQVAPEIGGQVRRAQENLGTLRTLLDGQNVSEEFVDAIVHPGVNKSYARFLQLIKRRGASLEFRISSVDGRVSMTSDLAHRRLNWLNEINLTPDLAEITGNFTLGDLIENRFSIQLDSGPVISGTVRRSARDSLMELKLGERVRAQVFSRIHKGRPYGEPTYELRSISAIP